MATRTPAYLKLLNALVLLGFGWLAILIELTPLNEDVGAMPAPDLLFCVCAFLVLRRPSATPGVLIVGLGLARELLGGGPVGLGALTLLAAVEVLRIIGELLHRRPLIFEFAAIGALILAISTLQIFAMLITFSPIPPLDQIGLRALGTIVAYLGVYVVFRWMLRVRGEFIEDRRLSKKVV